MKATLLALPLSLALGCGTEPPAAVSSRAAAIVGRVDASSLSWVSRVDALDGAEVQSSAIDERRGFWISVQVGQTYRLRLVDVDTGRSDFVLFADGGDQLTIWEDAAIDVGAITARSEDGNVPSADGPSDGDDCEHQVDDCRFTTYNLDVQVGDRFVITNFLEGCAGQVGADFSFGYEDGETWNLDAFNTDGVVEITAADLDGGNQGEGEYRFLLLDRLGEELDHMTVRIGHGDETDIRPGDDVPPAAGSGTGEQCGGELPDGDSDGIPDDVDADDDGDGIPDGI